MATEQADAVNNEEILHSRVRQRIAGHYLKQLGADLDDDGDGDNSKLRLSDNVDEETQKKIDAEISKYRRVESAYSIQNVLWLISAFAVFYYTDMVNALRYDRRIDRTWLNAGLLSVGITVSISLFLIIWVSCVKKRHSDDWERLYPAAIPIATAAFILGGICLTKGLWPIWSIFTPVILFVLFMGFVVTVAMLPNL
ncbi:hypothetical protein ScPMuIL_000017 [Solemya velum]